MHGKIKVGLQTSGGSYRFLEKEKKQTKYASISQKAIFINFT